MSSKHYTIAKVPDKRGKDGYMYHAYGPAITEAIKQGRITENDTWNPDKVDLINKLRAKGADV